MKTRSTVYEYNDSVKLQRQLCVVNPVDEVEDKEAQRKDVSG